MEYLVGFLTSSCILVLAHNIYLLAMSERRTNQLTEKLTSTLSAVADSHNKLNEAIAAMDRKVEEHGLRLSMMNDAKRPLTRAAL